MAFSNYSYVKNQHTERKPGIYRCIVMGAELGKSKSSGKDMLTIFLRPSGMAANIKAYIIDNEYADVNISEFLDAFPELRDGFDISRCYAWTGAAGAVRFELDENGYLKPMKYPWVPYENTDELPPFVWKPRDGDPGTQPVYQGYTEIRTDDGDIPF